MPSTLKKTTISEALYAYIALFILIANLSNLEVVENIISAFIAYEYLHLSTDYLLFDTGMIIMYAISLLNSLFKGIQLYSYFIFIFSFFSGFLFLNLIKKKYKNDPRKLFLISILFI